MYTRNIFQLIDHDYILPPPNVRDIRKWFCPKGSEGIRIAKEDSHLYRREAIDGREVEGGIYRRDAGLTPGYVGHVPGRLILLFILFFTLTCQCLTSF